jgi:hypothetical protein
MFELYVHGIHMDGEEQQNYGIDSNEDIEKRKPKPFRYITDLKEINDDIEETQIEKTVMTDEQSTSEHLIKNFESAIGVGDIAIVEQVLKKHKMKRENESDIGFA